MNEVYAFEVWPHQHREFSVVINARTAGKAKYLAWLDICDTCPEVVPITVMRSRKLGPPVTPRGFARVAEHRGRPELRCGARVIAEGLRGVIVGHNTSANFQVLVDDDSPEFAGQELNVHPAGIYLEGDGGPEGGLR